MKYRSAIADHLNSSLVFGGVRVAQFLKFFCFCFVLSYYVSLHSEFPVVMSAAAISAYNRCSARLPFVCRRAHVLFTLFVFVCVLCFVFAFFLRLMYSLLPFSLHCPFWVAPSEFASVYWENYLTCGINKFKELYSQIMISFLLHK